MDGSAKVKVAFYHKEFFKGSETFIYQQAINPHIDPLLIARRFLNSTGMPKEGFTKIQFKPMWWESFASKFLVLFGINQYYKSSLTKKLAEKISEYKPQVLHAQFGNYAIGILRVAKILKVPLVVSFHGRDASRMLRKHSYREGLKEVFKYVSSIVVCNPAMTDVLPLTSEQKQKVVWIPYGINLQQFNPQPRKENATLNILHVGRFTEKKGVPDLILAFSKIECNKNVKLHLVGSGREERKCQQLVKRYNLNDRVIFHGWKSPEEVKALMQEADVFVLNSRVTSKGDSEGLPVGILEAMAMALPVVSTNHAGIPHEVDHMVTGILVNEHDNNSLTQALNTLLQDSPLRLEMGAKGRAKAESKFTMEQMHISLFNIYKSIAKI